MGKTLTELMSAHISNALTNVKTWGGILYNATEYGAKGDGVTDDAAALQNLVNKIKGTGKRGTIWLPPGEYRLQTTLTMDVSYVSLASDGAVIDAAEITDGAAIFLTGSVFPPYEQSYTALSGIQIRGITSGTRSANSIGLRFDNTGDAGPSHITVQSCNIHGFGYGVKFEDRSYIINFIGCDIYFNDYGIYSVGTITDGGERLTFIGCAIYNNLTQVRLGNGNASMKFLACSLDYHTQKQIHLTSGRVNLIGCHLESDTDADYWWYVSGNGSTLTLDGCEVGVLSARNNYPVGLCASTVVLGGILIRDCFFAVQNYNQQLLISGTGRVEASGIRTHQLDKKFAISASTNVIRDGTFESANSLDDWSLGTNPPVLSSTDAHSGSQSLLFQGGSGLTYSASIRFPIRPGQIFGVSFWIKQQNAPNFFVETVYMDRNDNALYTGTANFQNTGDWNMQTIQLATPAPPGTTQARVSFSTGAAGDTYKTWIDDLYCSVM